MEKIICECGGSLTRPIPKVCPHCGAHIVQVHRRLGSRIYPYLIVALIFALMAGVLWWWVHLLR